MLVEKMNQLEISKEILSDYRDVQKSVDRLTFSYHKYRVKNKIDKTDVCPMVYNIKSKKKNNWLFVFIKADGIEKYKGVDSIAVGEYVYYYSSIGIRLFKVMVSGGLEVFNSHLLSRYNERMNLGLVDPLDIIERFISHNGVTMSKVLDENKTISICKEGYMFGELLNKIWLVQKTFITKEQANFRKEEIKKDLLKSLNQNIVDEITKDSFDENLYNYNVDCLKNLQ